MSNSMKLTRGKGCGWGEEGENFTLKSYPQQSSISSTSTCTLSATCCVRVFWTIEAPDTRLWLFCCLSFTYWHYALAFFGAYCLSYWWVKKIPSWKSVLSNGFMSLKAHQTPKHCTTDYNTVTQNFKIITMAIIISITTVQIRRSCYKVTYRECALGCIWLVNTAPRRMKSHCDPTKAESASVLSSLHVFCWAAPLQEGLFFLCCFFFTQCCCPPLSVLHGKS